MEGEYEAESGGKWVSNVPTPLRHGAGADCERHARRTSPRIAPCGSVAEPAEHARRPLSSGNEEDGRLCLARRRLRDDRRVRLWVTRMMREAP